MNTMITVGGLTGEGKQLLDYAKKYLTPGNGFAYPAYDSYRGSNAEEVQEADLLAIVLLNAGQQAIQTHYTLKTLLQPINERMSVLPKDETLATAGTETLEAVADLFGILDEHNDTAYVGKTKLLKVLHRKRPALIPLFDENIRQLYCETENAPVPSDKTRSHRDFARAWLPEVKNDLVRHEELWTQIARESEGTTPITQLRALDIVAWEMGAHVRNPNRKKLNLQPRKR